jgi:hypothetical protein
VLTPKKWLISLAVAAVAVGLATGCSQLPTAPPIQVLGTTAAPQRVVESSSLLGDVTSLIGDVTHLLIKVLNIVGSLGGSLTNGRWRVDVPPNAISGTATITIGVASLTSPSCQLGISPDSLNHFSVPVKLTVDCSSVSLDQLQTYSIFWYDPAKGTWTPVANSTVDLQAKTVSAPLQHFSQYAVGPTGGRASW